MNLSFDFCADTIPKQRLPRAIGVLLILAAAGQLFSINAAIVL
jgi:hypothetical protein